VTRRAYGQRLRNTRLVTKTDVRMSASCTDNRHNTCFKLNCTCRCHVGPK
jgi:hypothetical protein